MEMLKKLMSCFSLRTCTRDQRGFYGTVLQMHGVMWSASSLRAPGPSD